MKTTIAATLSGLLLMTSMGYASANPTPPAQKRPDIFAALEITKVSLDDAIKTAEHTVAGKLVSADMGNDGKSSFYRVAVADNNSRTLTFMKIDATNGKVLASKVYHPDNRAAANAAQHTSSKSTTAAKPAANPLKTPAKP